MRRARRSASGRRAFATSVARMLRVRGEAVGDDRLGDRRQDLAHVGVVDAQHRDAVERQPLREVDERALQPLEVVAVGLHVVGVDVGDHGQRRLQVEERRVGLVGLGDQELALAEPRVRVRRQEPAADHERRIEAAFGQHRRDQARRRRLAVRAGDRDALLQAHQLGQHQRARHDRNAASRAPRRPRGCRARPRSTRRPRRRRRRSPPRGRSATATPSRARRARDRARGEIGAGDLVALRREHLGDAAHAGAADADEVDALDLVLHRARPQRDAGVGDAIRGVEARELARGDRHREQRVARERAADRAASRSGVSSSCGDLQRRAGVDEELRVRALLVGDRAGQRHDDRRRRRPRRARRR